MPRLSFGFFISVALSCGVPDDLGQSRFPNLAQTGYPEAMDATKGVAGAPNSASELGCPEDMSLLFNRPIEQGGCRGSGCHIPGNMTPDLVSPHPEERLLNVVSRCNGRPYIGPDDSFLADKISGAPPECGVPMPFLAPQMLSAEDERCILDWIDRISVE